MMINVFATLLFLTRLSCLEAQIFLQEGFEGGARPEGWTEETASGNEPWRYRNGGHSPNDNNWLVPAYEEDITRNPPSAYEGTYNAIFFKQGDNNERTKLITPELNLLGGTSIELSFFLCQIPWTFEGSTGWDVLRIYYKTSFEGPWVLLKEYLDPVYDWQLQTLVLPDPSQNYYVAFEGHTRWGYGTCIDNVVIEEKGSQQLYVGEIDYNQQFNPNIPSGSTDVPLVRMDFNIFGNTGTANLQNINFKSLNTSDTDIKTDGLKLYATSTQQFSTDNPVGTITNFVSGNAGFTGLNHNLPAGLSYLWLACDINPAANHGNILDVMLEANSIMVNDSLYPASDQSPAGQRVIFETRYSEGFEGVHNWQLTGEFEAGPPNGSGGSPGNPDPSEAYRGTGILGTDLSGLGANPYNYEPDLNEASAYLAVSPTIETFYYTRLNIFFRRYMNIEVWDKSFIEVSADNGTSWHEVWSGNSYLSDFQWVQEQISIPDEYSRTNELKIRFRLGPTDGQNNYSGWNIDEFYLTGEFISKDVGVSAWVYPQSGSGHSANDSVTVRIRNYGGAAVTDPVPVAFSMNGGISWTIDTLYNDIPIADSVTFTFPTKTDLSEPGLKPSVMAKTLLPGDQYPANDDIATELYIVPTYGMPYDEDFEETNGYWLSSGSNMWKYGTPSGSVINSASSGIKSWITGTSETYGQLIAQNNYIIFEDNFESNTGWTFSGEFERNVPSNMHLPYFAYSGYYCLGTDLSGMGSSPYNYENGISSSTAYTATSPAFDVSSCSNVKINFAGWLMIQNGDSVRLEISPDNGTNWITLWKNTHGEILNADYIFHEYDVPDSLSYSTQMRFRFSLFYSSSSGAVAEGWNIDDFLVTGDLVNSGSAYLSSPSYDLRGLEYPVFEADMWVDTETGTDGGSLLYSLDDGNTWLPLNSSSSFDSYWNWYTGKYTEALERDGWSGQTGNWQKIKHLLPASLINQPDVQFRFEFKADKFNNEYDGIALDNVKIYEAPHDVGVLEIINPVSSCELSADQTFRLSLHNYGIRDMKSGDSIQIGYYIENSGSVQQDIETVQLTEDFPAGTSKDFSLNRKFDFSLSGEYLTRVFTIEEDPYYYDSLANDTVYRTILVNNPSVDLGPDISSTRPDTIILSAYDEYNVNDYLWQDGSTDPEYHVTTGGTYFVRVSNSLGCATSDTINILKLIPDVGASSILSPESSCESGNEIQIKINIENFGTDTLNTEDTIYVHGNINNSRYFKDTILLPGKFYPGETLEFTYSELFDFSLPGTYRMKLYTGLNEDVLHSNDTLSYNLEIYGYPDINLGPDTTLTAPSYTLNPAPGYFEYLWQDGSGSETFTIDEPGNGKYSVIVSDMNGCSGGDSVYVNLNMSDLSLDSIISPAANCNPAENLRVSARIRNTGNLVIPAGETINLNYSINGGTSVRETFVLTEDILPGATINYSYSHAENLPFGAWYDFIIYLDYLDDMKSSNDTVVIQAGIFEPPQVDLGESYQVITGLEHTIDAGSGFVSYEWQDGSTNQTFHISEPGIGTYGVTVTDAKGCSAYDEVEIMLAVPDVGVLEVTNPATSCDPASSNNVQIAVKNFGSWDIPASANIAVSYSLKGALPQTEKLVLDVPFERGSVLYHTFSKEENISLPGSYEITAATIYSADLIPSNDTIRVNAFVYEKPDLEIAGGQDTLTVYEPLTITIPEGFSSYTWQDGSTGNSFEITSRGAGYYWVTVTTDNGCSISDSIYIIHDLPDLAMDRIMGPVSACSFNKNTLVITEIINNGYKRIEAGEEINISYSVNNGPKTTEVYNFSSPLEPDGIRKITFNTPYDFSAKGQYHLEVSVDYSKDGDPSNNSLSSEVYTWGYPDVDLGEGSDTIFSDLPVILDAGAGNGAYLWQDNSTGSIMDVTQYGLYWVRVDNGQGCVTMDSVYVDIPLFSDPAYFFTEMIRIYPNPVSEYLKVSLDMEKERDIVLELYSINNSIILRKDLSRIQSTETEINVQHLNPGVYFLRVWADGKPHVFRLIVK